MTLPVDFVAARLDVPPAEVCAAADILSDDERQKARAFTFEVTRRRFVVARGTLRRLLAVRLGVEAKAIDLVYGKHGKPALGGRLAASGLRFNVSHCDDVAVYAFTRGCEVGVDVEAVRWFADADDVASRFFSVVENREYARLHALQKPEGFFNCWTRKEAFIKALGSGLYYPLDAFDVTLAPDEPPKILRVRNTSGERCRWTLQSFSPASGYVAAAAIEKS